MVGTYEYIQQHHAELQARAECSLGRKAEPSCTHNNNLPFELLIELGRAATEVQAAPSKSLSRRSAVYSNTQPIADAVCGYVLLVYTCPTAVNQDHMLRLDQHKMCITGGGGVLSCYRPPMPPGTWDSLTLARPCRRCFSTLWAWLCAVLQHASCKKQGCFFSSS